MDCGSRKMRVWVDMRPARLSQAFNKYLYSSLGFSFLLFYYVFFKYSTGKNLWKQKIYQNHIESCNTLCIYPVPCTLISFHLFAFFIFFLSPFLVLVAFFSIICIKWNENLQEWKNMIFYDYNLLFMFFEITI